MTTSPSLGTCWIETKVEGHARAKEEWIPWIVYQVEVLVSGGLYTNSWETQPWKEVSVTTRLLEKVFWITRVMIPSEEVYYRVDANGGTLDGIPACTEVFELSNSVPSGNPLLGGSSCNMIFWLSSEHRSWPLTKSTTAPIATRQGIPRTLRSATSLPKTKERIRGEVLLMNYGAWYQKTAIYRGMCSF